MPDGLRHCVDQDAFERALSELAKQQPKQEILLVGRGAAEQSRSCLRFGRGSGARSDGELAEGGVDFREVQRRARLPPAPRATCKRAPPMPIRP